MNRKQKLKQVKKQVKLTTMSDSQWIERFDAVERFQQLVTNYYKTMA
jgi:hypothetical protein